MDRLKTPAMPKLNKNDLLIVSTEHFNMLIDAINDILDRCNAELTNLRNEVQNSHKELTNVHNTVVNLQNECDVRHINTSNSIAEIKDNIAYLATVISEGGFLNE